MIKDILGPNAIFIITSYAITACVIISLIAWLIIDGILVRKKLKKLETKKQP